MTILLLGANGQVGFALRSTLAKLGAVTALAKPDIDFAVSESLRCVVRRLRPSAIVNGFFYESFNVREFQVATGHERTFVQDNHSYSVHGVLRGLHYQIPHPQAVAVVWHVAFAGAEGYERKNTVSV
jgi:dTDP-4-dehydrorhamnose 3,5-epimerase/RmlD substrate binding domain